MTKIKVALSPLETKIFMQDQYEVRTGIFDHVTNGKERPLSSVAMFPCEDFVANGRTYDILLKYARDNYREMWGLSIEEFMSLPQWKVRLMEKVSDEVMKKKTAEINNQLNGMNGKS